jgi:hypothetical protein
MSDARATTSVQPSYADGSDNAAPFRVHVFRKPSPAEGIVRPWRFLLLRQLVLGR